MYRVLCSFHALLYSELYIEEEFMNNTKVTNYFDKSVATINLISQELSDEEVKQLIGIFNSHEVYKWLFQRRRKGKKFDYICIKAFISWSVESFDNETNFTYLLKDNAGIVVGGGDLQRGDSEHVTIGYWANQNYRGYMINFIRVLVETAFDSGFSIIEAYPDKMNHKSRDILKRNNFQFVSFIDKQGYQLAKYIYSKKSHNT